jgi:hypothetical protein
LTSPDETLAPTAHAKIKAVHTARPIRADLDQLIDRVAAAAENCDAAQVLAGLSEAVPELARRESV